MDIIHTATSLAGNMSAFIVIALLSILVYKLVERQNLQSRAKAFEQKYGAKPHAPFLKPSDPSGIMMLARILSANRKHDILGFFHSLFQHHGSTFMNYTWRRTTYFTNDPENIKCALSTRFEDWAIKALRQEAVKELLGDGIFTTDGAFWAHSRAMLRPAFEKSKIADLDHFEKHIQPLLSQIPTDGSTVDLQDLYHRLSMDTSMELLTGQSTDSLEIGTASRQEADDFIHNFQYGMDDATVRSRLGRLYFFLPHLWLKASKSIGQAHKFVDRYVDRAMKHKAALKAGTSTRMKGGFVFLEELAQHDEVDATRIRNETLNVLLAGRDTTASLLSNMWFMLARNKEVWKKLQDEVDELSGELPSYETLRDMKYIKYCAQETLRLFPPVPALTKLAVRDTVLPKGGGDGSSPLFVPKGSVLFYNMHSMMRQQSNFGPDSEEWRPERWSDPSLRPGWAYLPFGGGPRVCLGQQYALTETYYVTIRLMQHFRRIENRDDQPWKEKLTVTCCSLNGTQVGLYKD
ncbi:Hypothetical protein R9X50_00529900 [Acrodontium crateriforme]|uniref:Cytochrome P450 alkane hydroxylase n=1 Tax=Acrodontium crateriforme TaxID=150365 RepID=A0AAQ3M7P4_9PEZI|nr:Hypothetical protein R9X50_00529900 [Acrodontium crateriforme]